MGLTVAEFDDMINVRDDYVVHFQSDEMISFWAMCSADMDLWMSEDFAHVAPNFQRYLADNPSRQTPLTNIFDQTPSKAPLGTRFSQTDTPISSPIPWIAVLSQPIEHGVLLDACICSGWLEGT